MSCEASKRWPCGSDVADLQHQAVAQFALNRQVVLTGVLGAQVGLEFAVQKDGAEQRQIRGLAFVGVMIPPNGLGVRKSA